MVVGFLLKFWRMMFVSMKHKKFQQETRQCARYCKWQTQFRNLSKIAKECQFWRVWVSMMSGWWTHWRGLLLKGGGITTFKVVLSPKRGFYHPKKWG